MPLDLVPIAVETRTNARKLFEAGLRIADIARQTGVSPDTLSQWKRRDKWQKPALAPVTIPVRVVKDEPKNVHSHLVKSRLAEVLSEQVRLLGSKKLVLGSLRNSRKSQGFAAVAKTIAETAAIVFDWKSDSKPGVLILAGDLPDPRPKETPALPPPPTPDPGPAPLTGGE